MPSSLNFDSGLQLAKVIGGDLAGETLYLSETKSGHKKKLTLPKGLKLPPRKSSELLLFLNDAYAKGITPQQIHAPLEVKEVYQRMYDAAESSTEIDLPPNSTFRLVPTADKKAREIFYICGPSGSGKSYIAKGLAEEYHKLFPDREIYVVSKLEEDSTLDKLKYLVRLDPAKLTENPITDLKVLDNSMVIFDDIENFDKATDKAIQNLVNQIASTGRHNNITMIYITHLLSDYKRTRLVLMEATGYVLYPLSTGAHAFNYMMKTYLGLDTKESAELKKTGSRWIYIKKHFPQVLITEHSAKVMNQ
jgi:energy-coupling factor transporter ATP-binding protein EcfA2